LQTEIIHGSSNLYDISTWDKTIYENKVINVKMSYKQWLP